MFSTDLNLEKEIVNDMVYMFVNLLGENKTYEVLYLVGRKYGVKLFKELQETTKSAEVNLPKEWNKISNHLLNFVKYELATGSFPQIVWKPDAEQYILRVYNNPLAFNFKTDVVFCGFIRGVIETFFTQVMKNAGVEGKVVVEEKECLTKGDEKCLFVIKHIK